MPTGLDRESVACMAGVPCDFCKISKYYRWSAMLPEAAVLRILRMDGRLRQFEVLEQGRGTRPEGAGHHRRRGAGAARQRAATASRPSKIRSTRWLDIDASPAGLALKGAGWGHGVGMCQMGAIGRAQQGHKGDEIVLAYYVGATLKKAY